MLINGFIDIEKLDGKFSFFFDGRKLNIIKVKGLLQEEKSYPNGMHDVLYFDNLNGKTSMGGDVYFFNLKLIQSDLLGNEYIGYCENILVPKTLNSFYKDFNSIIFKGNIVDKFYPPINCIDYDGYSSVFERNDDGTSTIKIKKHDDYTIRKKIEIDGVGIEIVLSVNVGILNKEMNIIGGLSSYLEMFFDGPRPIREIEKWYTILINIFQLIFNRQSVSFEKILLANKTDQKHTSTSQYFPLYAFKTESNEELPEKCIGYSHIIDKMHNLIKIMKDTKINMYHLPLTDEDHNYLNPQKYVFTASSFEYEFQALNSSIEDENIKIVTDDLIKELKNIDERYKGKNKEVRKISKSLLNTIENYSKALEVKISQALEKNEKIIASLKNKVLKNYAIVMENIDVGVTFAKARNKNAHGTIASYSDEEIASFLIVRALVYIMILKRCEIEDARIKMILDIHF